MKNTQKWIQMAGCLAGIAGILLIGAGCKSSGYEKANAAAENIQKAADRIGALPGQIDKTMGSLDGLVNSPQPDMKPQFKVFTSDLNDLESSAKSIAAARERMAEKSNEFLTAWDQQLAQIKNEDIKARSQSRKEQVAKQLQSIKESYAEAAEAFKPFMADLKDIHTYLSTDLTTGGIDSIKKTVAKVSKEAGPVKKAVAKVAEDFKGLGVALSSAAPPPAATSQ